jgi:hypothetical protein
MLRILKSMFSLFFQEPLPGDFDQAEYDRFSGVFLLPPGQLE